MTEQNPYAGFIEAEIAAQRKRGGGPKLPEPMKDIRVSPLQQLCFDVLVAHGPMSSVDVAAHLVGKSTKMAVGSALSDMKVRGLADHCGTKRVKGGTLWLWTAMQDGQRAIAAHSGHQGSPDAQRPSGGLPVQSGGVAE